MTSIYLTVPCAEKDDAKRLGARWDPQRKAWYVPSGKDSTPFSRWLGSPGKDAGENPETMAPAWLVTARRLQRALQVLLIELDCWKCGQPAYAVVQELQLHEGEEEDLPDGLLDGGGISSGPKGTLVLLDGGSVAHPCVAEQLAGFVERNPAFKGRIATFKARFSRTVGRAYPSQGCPNCDALWGDFPLSDLTCDFLEDIHEERYGEGGVLKAFEWRPGPG
ncbi:MAG TPA: DUF5710 domain-containing protein [Holophaga sp.]|nr:DUF5710 domain-containing protein [Holophaga sp.]